MSIIDLLCIILTQESDWVDLPLHDTLIAKGEKGKSNKQHASY